MAYKKRYSVTLGEFLWHFRSVEITQKSFFWESLLLKYSLRTHVENHRNHQKAFFWEYSLGYSLQKKMVKLSLNMILANFRHILKFCCKVKVKRNSAKKKIFSTDRLSNVIVVIFEVNIVSDFGQKISTIDVFMFN